jgi:hypothetical protein
LLYQNRQMLVKVKHDVDKLSQIFHE